MNEHDQTISQVAEALKNLGSSTEQARVMAEQLVKRADQMAKVNNSSLIEELGKLLETVSCGAQGRLKPSDEAELGQKNSKTPEKKAFGEKMFDRRRENAELEGYKPSK
jgi:hypothetical protein